MVDVKREVAISAMINAYDSSPKGAETVTATREIWFRLAAEHYVDTIFKAIEQHDAAEIPRTPRQVLIDDCIKYGLDPEKWLRTDGEMQEIDLRAAGQQVDKNVTDEELEKFVRTIPCCGKMPSANIVQGLRTNGFKVVKDWL